MKPHCHAIIEEGYLGSEILHSSSRCKSWFSKIIFAGAERIGCQWKVNFIFTFVCLSNTQHGCQGASSANMYVTAETGQTIRFENYLGLMKKETVEQSPGDYELCDRFFPIKYIKLLKIETDHIEYEICFV